MEEKNKDSLRGGVKPGQVGAEQQSRADLNAREYKYVLHISHDELAYLNQYRQVIAAGTARFAEVHYNYLFDNPDIADLLYADERDGRDVSETIRAELAFMLDMFSVHEEGKREAGLIRAGEQRFARGIKPVWVTGAYLMFMEFLRDLMAEEGIAFADRERLQGVLMKLSLRDIGLISEGYWNAALNEARNETAHVCREHAYIDNLLSEIPQLIWSVDIRSNRVHFGNYPLHALYPDGLDAPFPFLNSTYAEHQQLLLTAWQEAVNGNTTTCEVRISLAGAPEHWYRLALYPSLDYRGRTVQVHCVIEDINHFISERKQLEQLSTTDNLTQLPNRTLWADHLNMALATSRRVPGSQVAVISLDINHFKMYNDTLGREIGDLLLQEIAERLRSVVRESDSLARLGGDQFGILLSSVNDARTASERVINQVLDCFDSPFSCADKQLCVSLTMGAACFPDHGTNEQSLLTNAESAMYRAKRNSLSFQFFDPVSDVSPAEQLRYSGQIRSALDNNEFVLHYQPQVDLQTSQITGAEALLRWQHPLEGTVYPKRIIPVAEQLGMISPITDWVLATALKQCKQWICNGATVPVSVNVSARSFQGPRLVDKIKWSLEEAGMSGDCLEIEITEATLMLDLERAADVLSRLSDFGVSIAIDDFGTGYSSLSYLKRLPIHTLKIDQSFIIDVAFDNQDIAIVRSIIDLGHNLGYKVVAEGVESDKAWDMLNSLGCDSAQGFLVSHPLPEKHFASWLARSPASHT
jgi:diguanylate cyclase (GGDEF)-like protein